MKNKKELNLAQLTQDISQKLIDTIYLLEITNEIIEGDGKLGILIKTIKRNIKNSFYEVEKCRQKIYIKDEDY